jgi:voltage-gated potassium channel
MSGDQPLPSIFFIVLRRLRAPLIVLISAYALSIAGFVAIPGMQDDGSPWRMDFFHAFYFVSYMGSTIGFGEIPYAFTGAQRLWTLFSIYATVISWLYAIGTMIAILQDRVFLQAVARTHATHRIQKLRDPFYLVCGYGEAGKVANRFLREVGEQTVVIDRSEQPINELLHDDSSFHRLALIGDAADPSQLQRAGLTHPLCKGVIAVIGSDQENLKIAISAKLLNPGLRVIGRVSEEDTAENMRSFGTDHIINPFNTFAWHFALAFSSPAQHLLNDWLSQTDYQTLNEPVFPPRGKWILCGYGRFGKALHRKLEEQGNEIVVIEASPGDTDPPEGSIRGRGTEAITLQQAQIGEAVGIIAGTDNDTNNLSIIMTAMALHPDLFTVARQNQNRNAPLFEAARVSIVFNQNKLIASQIINLLNTPLTHEFLRRANKRGVSWSNELVSRIGATVENKAPLTWVLELTPSVAPAFVQARNRGHSIPLGLLYREPHNRKARLPSVPLMIARGEQRLLTPEDDTEMQAGDRVLFCGPRNARTKMLTTITNNEIMSYLLTGQHRAVSPLWRLVTGDGKTGY